MKPRRAAVPTESHLACLWAAQGFAGEELFTVDGRPVFVVHPGRGGRRAGPDFRDAVIQIDGGPPVLGDVELHRDAADFIRHGHALDPAYDGLALHVVFRGGVDGETVLASGRSVPVVAVPPDTRALGAGREPCATAVKRAGAAGVGDALDQAGMWRMWNKTQALLPRMSRDDAGQSLYRAIAAALGQTANAVPFELLAERLPLTELTRHLPGGGPEREGAVIARLLHAAGLDGAVLGPAPALPLVTRGLRPAAMPARRLHALARLVVRLGGDCLAEEAGDLIDRALEHGARGLISALVVRSAVGPALCGPARAVELAVNALLPWSAARAMLANDNDLAARILALAAALPAGKPYAPSAHLIRNLRDYRGRTVVTSALRQQGALAYAREWCRRGGCGRCPLS